ncbi:hypothetical protein P7C73_g5591, partial [Tremellales sp. Uapishka_1]
MTPIPTIEAEVFLNCQNELGEGILWDSKRQLLHWIDINRSELHTLDTETKAHHIDHYPESEYLSMIALQEDKPEVCCAPIQVLVLSHFNLQLLATLSHSLVLLPSPQTPTAIHPDKPTFTVQKSLKTLSEPLPMDPELKSKTRFNDGGCDPAGRILYGSMTLPELKDGVKRGELWRLDTEGKEERVLDGVVTSNGIGWSPDHKTMCETAVRIRLYPTADLSVDYIDSGSDLISSFDYDLSTGKLSNRKTLVPSPPPLDEHTPTGGIFDGLTIDGLGNIWAARWKDQRVLGYTPRGELIVQIKMPKCYSPTIPCFGGRNLDTMYITTATTKLADKGDIQAQFPHSGDLFKVDFSAGSEVRKYLAEGWKGAERYRFAG